MDAALCQPRLLDEANNKELFTSNFPSITPPLLTTLKENEFTKLPKV